MWVDREMVYNHSAATTHLHTYPHSHTYRHTTLLKTKVKDRCTYVVILYNITGSYDGAKKCSCQVFIYLLLE